MSRRASRASLGHGTTRRCHPAVSGAARSLDALDAFYLTVVPLGAVSEAVWALLNAVGEPARPQPRRVAPPRAAAFVAVQVLPSTDAAHAELLATAVSCASPTPWRPPWLPTYLPTFVLTDGLTE